MGKYLRFAACWFYNIMVAIDQLASALLTGGPDQTISAYLWHAEQEDRWSGRIGRPLVDFLFSFIEDDHCQNAWLKEPHERLNAVKHMVKRWENGEEIVA